MGPPAGPLPPAPAAPVDSSQRFPWTAIGIFGGGGLTLYYAWLWLVQGKAVGAALFVGPILVALTIPLFVQANRRNPAFDLGGLLLVSLVLRFGFVYYRSEHAVDAIEYHVEGERLARFYRALDFGVSTGKDVPGTGAMRAVSGGVHVLVADDYFASFLLMAWLGFLGCWFLYRAFETAVGDGDRSRYARLVLLWPSMCFWPSSLGKEAWMVFTIGVASYGAARVYQRLAGGYTLLGLGLLAASFVRPHLALLAIVAFVVALLIGRRDSVRDSITPASVAKIVGIALVVVIGSVLVSRTQKLLDIEDFSATSIEAASNDVTNRTSLGGSTFTPANPRTPLGFPQTAVTVLFRPFPTEASGFEQLFTSVEGIALGLITVFSLKRLLTLPRRVRAQPYIGYALVYVLLWIMAFGVIANFGILTRQRTQMLPFYFALLSVPAVVAKSRARSGAPEPHVFR